MILDTNALSDLLEGSAPLEAAMAGLGPLRLSPVVLGEHRYGLLRSSKRKDREATLRQMEATFETLPITGLTSRIYARIRGELRAKGKPIPANDLWIAAQAVEHGLPLVSRNDHFLDVKGLALVSWKISAAHWSTGRVVLLERGGTAKPSGIGKKGLEGREL